MRDALVVAVVVDAVVAVVVYVVSDAVDAAVADAVACVVAVAGFDLVVVAVDVVQAGLHLVHLVCRLDNPYQRLMQAKSWEK